MIVRGEVSAIESGRARLILIDYNNLVTKFITVSKDIGTIYINDIVIAFFYDDYFSDGSIVARTTGVENQGVPGPKGDTGEQGIQGIPGTNAPNVQAQYSVDGSTNWTSAYAKTQKFIRFSFEGGTAWGNAIRLEGPQGIQGLKGDTGETGPQGLQGIQGQKGDQGIQGINGEKGDKGDTGTTGPAGTTSWNGITDKPTTFTPTTHSQSASTITDFDTEVSNNVDVTANTTARHSHSNKTLLDAILQTAIDSWNSAVAHISDTIKHITATERTLWNTVSNKVSKNADITCSTKTKITYDSKGLVTGGADLTASDIPSLSWDKITSGKPTTIAGYGITDAYTKSEVDNKVSAVYKYKGSVTTYSSLPSSGQVGGDVYNVTDTGINYAWEGTVWDDIGGVEALATLTNNGLMTKENFSKLAGIATGATKNDTDANLRNRTNHTGTQTASTISDFVTTVRSVVLSGLTTATNVVITAADSVLTAMGKLQAQLNFKEDKQALGTIRINLGTPNVEEMALFQSQFNNKFEFFVPTLIEDSTDGGTTFTTSTSKIPSSNAIKDMMVGRGISGGFTIPRGEATRLTWNNVGAYVFLNYLYCYWSTAIHTCKIMIDGYKSGTDAWTTIATTGNGNGWPSHASVPHSSIPFSTSTVQYSKVRITFLPTWSTDTASPYYNTGVTINSIEWWGGYPIGKRDIYSVDRDKGVTFPAVVKGTQFTSTIATGLAPLIISSTTKVSNLNSDQVDSCNVNDSGTSSSDLWTAGKIVDYVGTAGYGDMLKTVYDSDGNGTVDNSDLLDGHAASYFAAAEHEHTNYKIEVGTTKPTAGFWYKII